MWCYWSWRYIFNWGSSTLRLGLAFRLNNFSQGGWISLIEEWSYARMWSNPLAFQASLSHCSWRSMLLLLLMEFKSLQIAFCSNWVLPLFSGAQLISTNIDEFHWVWWKFYVCFKVTAQSVTKSSLKRNFNLILDLVASHCQMERQLEHSKKKQSKKQNNNAKKKK